MFFIGDYFLDEIKGLAEATELDYKVFCYTITNLVFCDCVIELCSYRKSNEYTWLES